MHPDYLDYKARAVVRERAKWPDLKFLIRDITGLELKAFHVDRFEWGTEQWWLVEIKRNSSKHALSLKAAIYNCLFLGDNVVAIKAIP